MREGKSWEDKGQGRGKCRKMKEGRRGSLGAVLLRGGMWSDIMGGGRY
jgi:hypothetical protein